MDLFLSKNIKPMLIGLEGKPFDAPDYIFELKLDGERGIAYLDSNGTELRNKRNTKMLSVFPELSGIHKQVKKRCILDGEYIVMKEGKPDFYEVQRRSMMSNSFKVELGARSLPVSFVAYDILYCDDHDMIGLPLMERKLMLQKIVSDSPLLSVSRYIEGEGVKLYALAKQQDLEGIVAKRMESKYFFGIKTKDWTKIKFLKDDDFVVCGYLRKSSSSVSIILGQFSGNELVYRGKVPLATSRYEFQIIKSMAIAIAPPFPLSSDSQNVVWLNPKSVCTVNYMLKTKTGSLRQPVFKGLRDDKSPTECKETLA